MRARDIIAIIVLVGVFTALALHVLSPEHALSIVMFILGYYFGSRGASHAAGEGKEPKQ